MPIHIRPSESTRAAARFVLPPGWPSLVGATAHHAWGGVDPLAGQATYASYALPLRFE